MKNKVLLVLCDGMRPDVLEKSQSPFVKKILNEWHYNPNVPTVYPSVTLSCHMSLIHSSEPADHGIFGNTFFQVDGGRHGLFEQLRDKDKTSAFFYSWGQLKDIFEPYSLSLGSFVSSTRFGSKTAAEELTDDAINCIKKHSPDFVFLYLEHTDTVGHVSGWCSKEYGEAVDYCFECIEKVLSVLPNDYSVIITADHGGHEFTHGTNLPEDMIVPVFFDPSCKIDNDMFGKMSIIDISPSVCSLIGIKPSLKWKGTSVIKTSVD